MTDSNGNSVNVKTLRKLHQSDAAARDILEYFAQREHNSFETKVERLEKTLRRRGLAVSRRDIIRVFRELEELHCGYFVPGRHTYPSRFEWETSLISVGRAASGVSDEVEEIAEADRTTSGDEDNGGSSLQHRYMLRPDFEVVVDLPDNFTAAEAGRLADYIKTLPFN